jgi:hypothetical protein
VTARQEMRKYRRKMVDRGRIELPTPGFSVPGIRLSWRGLPDLGPQTGTQWAHLIEPGSALSGCPSPEPHPTRLKTADTRVRPRNVRRICTGGEAGQLEAGVCRATAESVDSMMRDQGRAPDVAMMQATDVGNLEDRAELRRLDWPSVGCVLAEREVSARPMVIGEVRGQDASQMSLAEKDDML